MAEKYSDPEPPGIVKRQAEENQKVYLWDVNQSPQQRRVKFLLNEEQQQRQVKLEMGDLFLKDHTSAKRAYMYRDEEDQTLTTSVSRWTSFRNALCCCCTTTTCCGRQRLVSRRPAFTNIVISQKGSHKSGKAKRDTELDVADGSQEKDDGNVESEEEEGAEVEDVLPHEEGIEEEDVYPKKEGGDIRHKEEVTDMEDNRVMEAGSQEENVPLKGEATQVDDVLPHEEGTVDDVHPKREEDVHPKEEVQEKEDVQFKEAEAQGEDVPLKEDDEKREGDDKEAAQKAENKKDEDVQPTKMCEKNTTADTNTKEEESSEEIMADITSIDEQTNAINDVEEKISSEKLDDETKPKRGKLSRIRRFLRRLCCCCWCGSKED